MVKTAQNSLRMCEETQESLRGGIGQKQRARCAKPRGDFFPHTFTSILHEEGENSDFRVLTFDFKTNPEGSPHTRYAKSLVPPGFQTKHYPTGFPDSS